jgi:hypothetical protein
LAKSDALIEQFEAFKRTSCTIRSPKSKGQKKRSQSAKGRRIERTESSSSDEESPPPEYDANTYTYDLSVEFYIGKVVQYRKTVDGRLFVEEFFADDAIKALMAKHNRYPRELIPEIWHTFSA